MTATLIIILFLLGAAAVAILPLSALMLIDRKAGQEKQQEAVMRSGNVQSRPATVVSIMPTSLVILSTLILFLLNMLDDKGLLSDDMQPSDSFLLLDGRMGESRDTRSSDRPDEEDEGALPI